MTAIPRDTPCTCGHARGIHTPAAPNAGCRCLAVGCTCLNFKEVRGGRRYIDPADLPPKGESVLDRLHHHEPVFVIRAADPLSPQTLAAYAALARTMGLHDHARGVEARAVQFLRWQAEHPDVIRPPD